MSVTAYRVNYIDREKHHSFSPYGNSEILDWLIANGDVWDGRNNEGVGMVEIQVSSLKGLLISGIELSEYERDMIEGDIEWAWKTKDEYIMYDCY